MGVPHAKPVKVGIGRTRNIQVPLLDDKINIMDKKRAEAFPGIQRVLKTVGGIQTLVVFLFRVQP